MRVYPVLVFLALTTALFAQAPLRVHGSTTVESALEGKHAELENLVGRKIEFSATNTTAGLASLAAGRADMAMLSSPIEEVANRLNERTPGSIDLSQFRAAFIGQAKIAFIVNPRNRIRKLSAGQLTEIFTGKTTNWKEVGGADAPITVVTLLNASPLVQNSLLRGAQITSAARLMPTATQIPVVVAQEPNAIGIISTTHVKGPTSLVQTDVEISVPLLLVTKGEPKPAEKLLIDAARKLLNQPGTGKE
jgi:phosphate transport system substrate-binding protein